LKSPLATARGRHPTAVDECRAVIIQREEHFVMKRITTTVAGPILALVIGAGSLAGVAFADDAMKAGGSMSAHAMKTDCMKKAGMESDAMKKKSMEDDCTKAAAMGGDAMKAGDAMKTGDAMGKPQQ
jgi:pentapeptide MXKDX repeat protein